jgi:nitrogen fixation NifU-like protein
MTDQKELMPYTARVMDHFLNPRNMGDIPDADAVGEVGSPVCGDVMKIWMKIHDGKIDDARFKTFGCGSAIASSSMATELLKGRTIDQALHFTNQEVLDALGGLPAHKIHCSVLAEDAVRAALLDYLGRHPEFPMDAELLATLKKKQAAHEAAEKEAAAAAAAAKAKSA